MTEKISGFSKAATDNRLAKTRGGDEAAQTRKAGSAAASEAAVDKVELTGAATRLKNLETRLQGLDDVDTRRVAELRQRIEAGEYELNPERIAESILELERKLQP